MKRTDPRTGLARVARRLVLVMGAGALGAVVCSTGVYLFVPAPPETQGQSGGSSLRGSPALATGTSRQLEAAERRALGLLRRAGRAQTDVSYQGTKQFRSWSRWGQTTTQAGVRNVPGQGVTITSSAGKNSELLTAASSLDLSESTLTTLTQGYRLQVAAFGALLTRPVTRVDVARPDGLVVGRFWLDDTSGLALQRELLNTAGQVIRQSSFTELRVDMDTLTTMASTSPAAPTVSPDPTASVSTQSGEAAADAGACSDGLTAADLDALGKSGWDLPGPQLAGLRQVCAREVGSGTDRSVQLSYSDGLFALSLFAQRGQLASPPTDGFSRRQIGSTPVHLRCGLYRELSWAGAGMVYTLVTDVPDATVVTVVAGLPTVSADTGVLARMSRGIRRVGSWVDPFR